MKGKTAMLTWKTKKGMPNQLLEGDGFCISYNPDTLSILGGLGAGDVPEETALVKGSQFFILNGDWRKHYERLLPDGWDACFSFFKKRNKRYVSSWSDKP